MDVLVDTYSETSVAHPLEELRVGSEDHLMHLPSSIATDDSQIGEAIRAVELAKSLEFRWRCHRGRWRIV